MATSSQILIIKHLTDAKSQALIKSATEAIHIGNEQLIILRNSKSNGISNSVPILNQVNIVEQKTFELIQLNIELLEIYFKVVKDY